jgi:hypothetical protein
MMTVKTVHEAEKNLQAANERLENAVRDGQRAGSITDYLNEVAEAQGALTVVAEYEEVLDYTQDADEFDPVKANLAVIETLTRIVLRGADDTWSGRGNDARRAYFDGVRETADDLLREHFRLINRAVEDILP